SKDEGGYSELAAMVRDASLRDAPHHEAFETVHKRVHARLRRAMARPPGDEGGVCWSDLATQTKAAGFPPPLPVLCRRLRLSAAAEARSAATGWRARARRPRSTGGWTAPGCSPLPRWCRPASGWPNRFAAR